MATAYRFGFSCGAYNVDCIVRLLACDLRGAWKVVEKPALLTQTPGTACAMPGALCENVAHFPLSGVGGIKLEPLSWEPVYQAIRSFFEQNPAWQWDCLE